MKKYLFLSFVAVLLLTACKSVPITGRKQLNLVSNEQVLSSSLSSYKSYMSSAKVSSKKVESDMVVRVGKRIAAATESYLKNNGMTDEVKNFAWEFNLVEDSQINAFCMPGGKIVVYTGLMNLISGDSNQEDELATVLGHEVAHAVAKHSNERMSQQLLAQYGASALSLTMQMGGVSSAAASVANSVYGLGANYGVMLPFSRKHELEADYMGVVLMTIAGYNPDASIQFWTKMSSGTKSTSEFTSTHPSDAKRIAQLKKCVPEIKAKYGK